MARRFAVQLGTTTAARKRLATSDIDPIWQAIFATVFWHGELLDMALNKGTLTASPPTHHRDVAPGLPAPSALAAHR
jgi:hypothetical protein